MKLKEFGSQGRPWHPLISANGQFYHVQWQIQDFPGEGRGSLTSGGGYNLLFGKIFAENCMKNEAPLPALKLPLKRVVVNSFVFDLAFKGYCLGKETAMFPDAFWSD